ncbi:hypothetical protein CBS11350_10821 [Aspergillus niger]|nr:hypothetical protein CBS11350_10821 [Aspergillus niger]
MPSSFPPESFERGMSPIPQLPDLQIPGLLDVAVRDYSIWQQSLLDDEGLKAEVRKACDVALDDGLDLEQINEDKDPEYFRNRGVKWGIARRFVKDIRLWADKYKATVVG